MDLVRLFELSSPKPKITQPHREKQNAEVSIVNIFETRQSMAALPDQTRVRRLEQNTKPFQRDIVTKQKQDQIFTLRCWKEHSGARGNLEDWRITVSYITRNQRFTVHNLDAAFELVTKLLNTPSPDADHDKPK